MPETSDAMILLADKVNNADVVVFDLDGTLIETDVANHLAYDAAITHFLGQDHKEKLPSTKRVTREVLRECLVTTPQTIIQRIVRYKEEIYSQFLHATAVNKLMQRLLELSQGKEVILASDCHHLRGELILSYHGMSERFTRKYFFGNDNSKHKYERILRDLDMDSGRVIVFDDDPVSTAVALAMGVEADSVFLVDKSW